MILWIAVHFSEIRKVNYSLSFFLYQKKWYINPKTKLMIKTNGKLTSKAITIADKNLCLPVFKWNSFMKITKRPLDK